MYLVSLKSNFQIVSVMQLRRTRTIFILALTIIINDHVHQDIRFTFMQLQISSDLLLSYVPLTML